MSELPPTGERFLPSETGRNAYEHYHRYAACLEAARGKVVLDVASGEGYGASLLAGTAKMVIGVELDSAAVRHARETYGHLPNLSFIVGDCRSIPLKSKSVDLIVSFETIEHIERQDEMVSELVRLLRPDGLLIISSPDREHYSERTGHKNPFHVRELTHRQFVRLFEKNFRHVHALRQRLAVASFILDEGEAGPAALQSYMLGQRGVTAGSCALRGSVYSVLVCGQKEKALQSFVPSVHLDPEDDLFLQHEQEMQGQAGKQAADYDALLREHMAIVQAHDRLIEERATFLKERTALFQEHDKFLAERDIILKERAAQLQELDKFLAERDVMLKEREAFLAERNTLFKEHEAVVRAHNGLVEERATFLTERTALLQEHETFLAERDAIRKERETFLAERDALFKEHEAVVRAHNGLVEERATFLKERTALLREHEAFLAERDAIRKERETFLAERDALFKEHEAVVRAHNGLVEERATFLEERTALLQEHEAFRTERDTLSKEHHALVNTYRSMLKELETVLQQRQTYMLAHDKLVEEHRTALSQHNALIVERDFLERERNVLRVGMERKSNEIATLKVSLQAASKAQHPDLQEELQIIRNNLETAVLENDAKTRIIQQHLIMNSRLQNELVQARDGVEMQKERIREIFRSTSWRITAPLRFIKLRRNA